MLKINQLFVLFMVTFFIFPVAIAAEQVTVEKFIAQQKVIRVFMNNGMNFGNQASTANVMSRVRQMGFTGNFELLYGNVSTKKITTLFNLPADIPDIYLDAKRNITFIKMRPYFDRLMNNTVETVDLSFTVEDDADPCDLAGEDGIDIDPKDIICRNTANFMRAKAFIQFAPYFGTRTRLTDIYFLNQKNELEQNCKDTHPCETDREA